MACLYLKTIIITTTGVPSMKNTQRFYLTDKTEGEIYQYNKGRSDWLKRLDQSCRLLLVLALAGPWLSELMPESIVWLI